MPSDRDLRAAVEALADEWDREDEREMTAGWASDRLRAILAEHPATSGEPDAGGEGLTAEEREALNWGLDRGSVMLRVERILADRERWAEARGAERALQEAAADFAREWPVYGDDWLRDRADRIAGEGR